MLPTDTPLPMVMPHTDTPLMELMVLTTWARGPLMLSLHMVTVMVLVVMEVMEVTTEVTMVVMDMAVDSTDTTDKKLSFNRSRSTFRTKFTLILFLIVLLKNDLK